MEEIEEKWQHLRLLEDEEQAITFDEDVGEELKHKRECSLVGKFCMDRNVSKEVLENTMKKVWRISRPAKFQEVGTNVFTISFANIADKQRVWSGRPWLFDYHLFVLKPLDENIPPQKMKFLQERFWVQLHDMPLSCMNENRGKQIGNTIGVVEEVDVKEDGSGWGRFLRVLIDVDLYKPLARCRTINVGGDKIWIPIRYEKLPIFCFSCGCIVHDKGGCANKGGGADQYGTWLRAVVRKEVNIKREGGTNNRKMYADSGKSWYLEGEESVSEKIEKPEKGINEKTVEPGKEMSVTVSAGTEIKSKDGREGLIEEEMNKVIEEEVMGGLIEKEVRKEGEGCGEACNVLEREQREDLNETLQNLINKKTPRKGEWKRRESVGRKKEVCNGEGVNKKRRNESVEGREVKRKKEKKENQVGVELLNNMVEAVQQPTKPNENPKLELPRAWEPSDSSGPLLYGKGKGPRGFVSDGNQTKE
ncbi:uncharacterized protein LOC122312689 [Carya illinoinensis]|uniref:uncharacterized protein LOC122312689 n=1 Tax=Carya illinoinensis TaxID=32201 RepID=UPI001C723C83|nr:uncharacterized protein LOC122312689 [Carya illinoinensis]